MVQPLSDQPVLPTYIAQLFGLNIELSCEFCGDGFLAFALKWLPISEMCWQWKKNLNVCEIKTPHYGNCLKNYFKKEKTSWGVSGFFDILIVYRDISTSGQKVSRKKISTFSDTLWFAIISGMFWWNFTTIRQIYIPYIFAKTQMGDFGL